MDQNPSLDIEHSIGRFPKLFKWARFLLIRFNNLEKLVQVKHFNYQFRQNLGGSMVKTSDLPLEYDGSKPVPRYWTFNWQISKIIQMSNNLDKNIKKET